MMNTGQQFDRLADTLRVDGFQAFYREGDTVRVYVPGVLELESVREPLQVIAKRHGFTAAAVALNVATLRPA
jgi:hypothetical protein